MAPPKPATASRQRKRAYYMLFSRRSILWFLLSLMAVIFIMVALLTPYWLISPYQLKFDHGNYTKTVNPSLGLNSRCKKLSNNAFECNSFSMLTANEIFPLIWKISFTFMSLGFILTLFACCLTLASCCNSSICGKSIHSVTGSIILAGSISAMIATFIYPLSWIEDRVSSFCPESSFFYHGECSLGYSFYSSIIGITLGIASGVYSLTAEKQDETVKRRIEENNERLIFVP